MWILWKDQKLHVDSQEARVHSAVASSDFFAFNHKGMKFSYFNLIASLFWGVYPYL